MKPTRLLSTLFALAVLTTAGATQAQTRTWGFSKDTVYEWASGRDTVLITNSGTDSLRFDSIGIELIKPVDTHYEISFQQNMPGSSGAPILAYDNGNTQYIYPSTGPKNWGIAAGQTVTWRSFNGNRSVIQVAKQSAIVKDDTVHIRLILIARNNRGRDTVTFLSKQDGPSAIWSGLRPARAVKDGKAFDLRGRRAEKNVKGARVPARAIVTEKK